MKVKAWGTRGSIAISDRSSVETGGNTTCYEVKSECFPKAVHVILDAGTGLVPAGREYLPEIPSGLQYVVLFTHWHYDHIMGLTLAPPTFVDDIPMTLYGPVDEGVGPAEMIKELLRRPFFPVDAKRVTHKMKFKPLPDFDVSVIIAHPDGGFATFNRDRYVTLADEGKRIPMNGSTYPLAECMVISMVPANHGNSTCISYRFQEMPTGKVFVFCTDHEDMVGIPLDLRKHFSNADLLVIDGQYQHDRYMDKTSGFGHGTAYGVVKQAFMTGVKRVGITHHDPGSSDDFLKDVILQEAEAARAEFEAKAEKPEDVSLASEDDVFIVKDYDELDV